MNLLEAHSLHVEIAGKAVCRDLSFAVAAGECWALLGGNGVGKTTLLHTLAGLRGPRNGTVFLSAAPIAHMTRRTIARRAGVLFQDSEDPFPSTVLETALIGRHPYLGAWQWETSDDEQLARHALQRVELGGMEQRMVDTLSGGERRRLALATVLVQDPRLYLLDEPTNHLDLRHQIAVLELFAAKAREQGAAVLMVLHDVNLAARFCDHLLLLFGDGATLHGETEKILSESTLARLYGHPVTKVQDHTGTAWLPR